MPWHHYNSILFCAFSLFYFCVFIFITFFYYRNGYIPGEGIAPLPIENTSVIDMSVSEGSLIDILLDELMKVEKAEYDGQARSIEHDIINHQHYLIMEHVSVMVECQVVRSSHHLQSRGLGFPPLWVERDTDNITTNL